MDPDPDLNLARLKKGITKNRCAKNKMKYRYIQKLIDTLFFNQSLKMFKFKNKQDLTDNCF